MGSDAQRSRQDHPTVKPITMLEDALLDGTNRGDLVLHPFLGSGSTLIAAEFGLVAKSVGHTHRLELRLTNIDAELEQFTMNARSAPEWIRQAKGANKPADLNRRLRPTARWA